MSFRATCSSSPACAPPEPSSRHPAQQPGLGLLRRAVPRAGSPLPQEVLEISHHVVIQYRLPTTGEIVPLLQIAPSKTDHERVLLVSPELADVLATIIRRVRDPRTGVIPLLSAYDYEERVWNPPAPCCSSGTALVRTAV